VPERPAPQETVANDTSRGTGLVSSVQHGVDGQGGARLVIGILANHAELRDGLLYISGGGIDRIVADAFPTELDCCIVLMAHVPPVREEVALVGLLLDDQGDRLGGIMQRFALRQDLPFTSIPYLVKLRGAVLPRPGMYRFFVGIDGDPIGEIRFDAVVAGEDTSRRDAPVEGGLAG
jgi:hypothetical protein